MGGLQRIGMPEGPQNGLGWAGLGWLGWLGWLGYRRCQTACRKLPHPSAAARELGAAAKKSI